MVTKVEDGKLPRLENGSTYPNTSSGLAISSDNSDDTYGAYVVLAADIGNKDIYLNVLILDDNVTGKPIFSFAIGAGGSEIDFLTVQHVCKQTNQEILILPLGLVRVPANSRLTIRVKDDQAGIASWDIMVNFVSS